MAIKNFEDLVLSDDFMFCTVMRNEELCKETLSAILYEDIDNISYTENQKVVNLNKDSKSVRLDVYIASDEAVFDMEMQRKSTDNLPARSRYYSAMIDLNSLNKGHNYKDLPTNYVIFICTFPLFDGKKHKYTFENICEEDPSISLDDGTVKIFLSTKGTENDIPDNLKDFLTYLDSGIQQGQLSTRIHNEVIKIRNNEKWRLDYMAFSVKFEDELMEAREIAHAKGIAAGRLSMLKEIIKTNIDNNVPIQDIANFTGESIDNIKSIIDDMDKESY